MDFRVDGKKVTMTFGVEDIYNNTINFKTHRDYIKHVFSKHNFKILKWNWDVNPETGKWVKDDRGVEFKSTSSQIDLKLEVIGTIGLNIQETTDATDQGNTGSGILYTSEHGA